MLQAPIALVIFLITILTSIQALRQPMLRDRLILNPVLVKDRKEYYRLLTSGFIHGDYMHLVFNMLAFFFFAFQLEYYIGHIQFFILYIACLLVADMPTMIRQDGNIIYRTLGASGAISGVFASYVVCDPVATVGLLFIPIPFEAWNLGLIMLIYTFIASFAGIHRKINHDAHLWGMLAGVVFTLILVPEEAREFIDWIASSF